MSRDPNKPHIKRPKVTTKQFALSVEPVYEKVAKLFPTAKEALAAKKAMGEVGSAFNVYRVLIHLETMPVDERPVTGAPNLLSEGVDVAVYADGSISKNPGGVGGWGVLVVWMENGIRQEHEISGLDDVASTNNRAEILAVVNGLAWVRAKFGAWVRAEVVTDSMYVIDGATVRIDKWKFYNWVKFEGDPVANRELWERIDDVTNGMFLRWRHVAGHTGVYENERADRLAGDAVRAEVARRAAQGTVDPLATA